eukprot:12124507-Karenia_brevis.AAC.1
MFETQVRETFCFTVMTDYGVRDIFSYYEYLEVLVGLAMNGNELDIVREATLGEQLHVVAKRFSYSL